MNHKELYNYLRENFHVQALKTELNDIVNIVNKKEAKRYDISFGGHVLAGVKVSGEIEVIEAIDGYGHKINIDDISVTEINKNIEG